MGNPKLFPSDKLDSQYAVLPIIIDHDEAIHVAKWFCANHLAVAESNISRSRLGINLDHGRSGRLNDKPFDWVTARSL